MRDKGSVLYIVSDKGSVPFFSSPFSLLILRRNAMMGLPCGNERFVKKLEKKTGRSLHFRPQGRPKLHAKGKTDA